MYGIYLAPKLHAKPEDLHLEELQASVGLGHHRDRVRPPRGSIRDGRVWGLARSPYILGANNVLKPGNKHPTRNPYADRDPRRGALQGSSESSSESCSIERMQLWGMGAGPQEGS